MHVLKVKTNDTDYGYILCDCGALLAFSLAKVKMMSKVLTECEVCKTQILITDVGPITEHK